MSEVNYSSPRQGEGRQDQLFIPSVLASASSPHHDYESPENTVSPRRLLAALWMPIQLVTCAALSLMSLVLAVAGA
jgi:hypothetical protein